VKKITRSDHRILEKEGKLEPEPMLIENLRRFVLFPIEHDNGMGNVQKSRGIILDSKRN